MTTSISMRDALRVPKLDPFRLRVRCIVCRQWPRIAQSVLLTPEAAKRLRIDVAVWCGSEYCRNRIERGDITP